MLAGFTWAFLAARLLVLAGEAEDKRASPAHPTYNGISLPSDWPPRWSTLSRQPVTPPYLQSPPGVIPIDLGRQLFVDDFLIERTTLRRTFHAATYHPATPVLRGNARHQPIFGPRPAFVKVFVGETGAKSPGGLSE